MKDGILGEVKLEIELNLAHWIALLSVPGQTIISFFTILHL